jgi:hypothetical protein
MALHWTETKLNQQILGFRYSVSVWSYDPTIESWNILNRLCVSSSTLVYWVQTVDMLEIQVETVIQLENCNYTKSYAYWSLIIRLPQVVITWYWIEMLRISEVKSRVFLHVLYVSFSQQLKIISKISSLLQGS